MQRDIDTGHGASALGAGSTYFRHVKHLIEVYVLGQVEGGPYRHVLMTIPVDTKTERQKYENTIGKFSTLLFF